MNLKNIALCFSLGRAYGLGRAWALRQGLAQDADRWITVKPNGPDDKGTPVKLDAETGEVKAGMGGKFNGKHISAVAQRGRNEEHGAQAKIDQAKAIANGWEPKKKADTKSLLEKRLTEFSDEERKLDNEGFEVKEDDYGLQWCTKKIPGGSLVIRRSKYGSSANLKVLDDNGKEIFSQDTSAARGNVRILEDYKAKIDEAQSIAKNGVRDKLRSEMSLMEKNYDNQFVQNDFSTAYTEISTSRNGCYYMLEGDKSEYVQSFHIQYRDKSKSWGNWSSFSVNVPKDIPNQLLNDIVTKHLSELDGDSYRKQVNALKKTNDAIKADIKAVAGKYPKYQYQINEEAKQEERRKERDHHATLGADSSRSLKNNFSQDHIEKINNAVLSSPKPIQAVWNHFVDKLRFTSTTCKETAFFSAVDGAIKLEANEIDTGDDIHPKGETLFHESFHNIDWLAADGEDAYFSYEYKDNILGKTLRKEVDEYFKSYLKELNEALSHGQAEFLEKYGDKTPPSLLYDIKNYKKKKFSIADVRKFVTAEMNLLPNHVKANLSDMFQGATDGKYDLGFGHSASYWKLERKLTTEAFAEFNSSLIANPESYNLLNKILPKSSAIYVEMMNELAKRYE